MKNSILSLGTVLTSTQQTQINGGITICDSRHCWQEEDNYDLNQIDYNRE